MSSKVLILHIVLCVEYKLLRPDSWPERLDVTPYTDTGEFRTYFIELALNEIWDHEFIKFINELRNTDRFYRLINLDKAYLDHETHHLPTED